MTFYKVPTRITRNQQSIRWRNFSSLFCVAVSLLFMNSITHINYGKAMAQRNPPPASSLSNSDDFMYGRGDIPIFNDNNLNKILIAALRKLIIAIR